MKTYYLTISGIHVRFYYDPHLRLWTIYPVSLPSDDGSQIDAVDTEYTGDRHAVRTLAEYIAYQVNKKFPNEVAA